MDDKNMNNRSGMGVEMNRVLAVLWKKAIWIVVISLVGAILAFAYSKLIITPQYEATVMFYVNNSAEDKGNTSQSISSSDISAGKSLVDPYLVILNTNATLREIIEKAGVDYDCETLREKITAESVKASSIFSVSIESSNPERALKVAEAVAQVLPERISGIIEGSSAVVVDDPVLPEKPSSPRYMQNTLIGFIFTFILIIGVILLREIFDTRIRSEKDIEQICNYPVLTNIPDMTQLAQKKEYGYIYGRSRGKSANKNRNQKTEVIGDRLSFAANEAYKLLRTKIQFSFADDSDCHVIGICSSISGEGKSLTSVNLACTLAQLNYRILLIDADLRKSTIAEKTKLAKHPGLSDFLTKQTNLEEVIQTYQSSYKYASFHVITAGHNPPNPAELLDSARMQSFLKYARTQYDYIILDLPPVNVVSDAMVVADQMDGVLVVARQNYCNRPSLSDMIRQFEFVNAKILGVVFNGVKDGDGVGYFKKYGKSYY